ncbi:lantibiotic dehydratase [Streptomyces sp. NPDC089799]|uniref:lantibiotic dehydratase n=1 Tax=Streptomyces sp. NPDC089799 TaxID=3155066 RepID=UPI00342654FD
MRVYRCVDAALVRAAAVPGDRELPPWPALDGASEAQVGPWRRWLEQVWTYDGVADAVEVASPALARGVREVCAGRTVRPKQVRRTVVSMVRYLLRMGHRATPFGLFAGIAPARVGGVPEARWGERHRVVVRAGAGWLAGVVTRLEACPELLLRLPVMADNTAFVRNGRLVVPFQQPAHGAGQGATEVTVRHTRAVQLVRDAARLPVTVGDLAGKLAAEYPGTPPQAVERLLAELVSRRVLLTALRAPMTATDALGHLVDHLTEAAAGTIPAVAPILTDLTALRRDVDRHNTVAPQDRPALRAGIVTRMRALSDTADHPLMVDLLLDCALTLPEPVAREAERAVAALTRLTPYPSGAPEWRDYHERFLERYGLGAVVPVRELLDGETGLGWPAGYQGSVLEPPGTALTRRDERLIALAQRAAVDGAREVVLDDRALDALAGPAPAAFRAPAHTELYFHLQAPTGEALAGGDFRLVIGALSPAAGTTTGRFVDLLDGPDRERTRTLYAALPTEEPGAGAAQVSSPPLLVATENIARVPALLPHLIPLAEYGDPGGAPAAEATAAVMGVDTLAVSGDRHRLRLVDTSTGRTVEPTTLNAVEPTRFTQPLARFLCELPRAGASVAPFVWGAARRAPFLPRVRYGRTVLAPARWTVPADDLPATGSPSDDWGRAFGAWRRRFRMPAAVFLGDDDRRLRLDLDEPGHLPLLREELDRTGQVTLHEAPEPGALGWFDGHAHEIAMPFTAGPRPTEPGPAPAPTAVRSAPTAEATAAGREFGHLPGASAWAYLKLYGHPARHAEILAGHLPALLDEWEGAPAWWFVRYRDPEPHLRLRFPVSPGDGSFERIGAWTAGLRRAGLAGRVQWDTYYPETGRYGQGPLMAAAEAVFAADSAAALAQVRLTGRGGVSPAALTAAGLTDLARAFTGGARAGARWLVAGVGRAPGPGPERAVQEETARLTDPVDGPAVLRSAPGGEEVVRAWRLRAEAVAGYAERLDGAGAPDRDAVLASLLHMHHIRAIGLDEDSERECLRLARSAAQSWTARRETVG